MTEIPEDIMKVAGDIYEEARLKGNKFVTRDAIAAAICAERERAAKVIESIAHDGLHASMWERKFQNAADKIRKGEAE